MVFSSVIFLCIFLPIVIIGYYCMPFKAKNIFLFASSLLFYAWGEPRHVKYMIFSIIGNYLFGLIIHYSRKKSFYKVDKITLVISVMFNLGLLFYFKYFTFIMGNISTLFHVSWDIKQIALPIGISFYTFQGMSYVIDVYRQDFFLEECGDRREIVQKSLIDLGLYISMFPQLIAGPIVRYEDIRIALKSRVHSSWKFAAGIERFVIGLSKKVIVSNVLGATATQIMETDFGMINTPTAWLGAICYMLQIYYDFSGYSDMAIGLGKIFGFEFMENFDYPYISKSITEFWRRWHISLSSWFRDYLYIPLGGNRKGNVYVNLSIVFLATGIWHGAAWGFILWGIWHGIFILIERYNKKKGKEYIKNNFLKWLYSMMVVLIGWVLFRIVSVNEFIEYLQVMFGFRQYEFVRFNTMYYLDGRVLFTLIVGILGSFPLKKNAFVKSICEKNIVLTDFVKKVVVLSLLVICFLFVTNSTYNPFIYFRF